MADDHRESFERLRLRVRRRSRLAVLGVAAIVLQAEIAFATFAHPFPDLSLGAWAGLLASGPLLVVVAHWLWRLRIRRRARARLKAYQDAHGPPQTPADVEAMFAAIGLGAPPGP